MIVIKSETVYGIDVFTFKSSQGTPYQLTFEKNIDHDYYDVCLVNLLGRPDSAYCTEIRKAVKSVALPYLIKKETLFFNIEYSGEKKLRLLFKFLRWIKLEKAVKCRLEITKIDDIEYLEVYLTLDPKYINTIEVIQKRRDPARKSTDTLNIEGSFDDVLKVSIPKLKENEAK